MHSLTLWQTVLTSAGVASVISAVPVLVTSHLDRKHQSDSWKLADRKLAYLRALRELENYPLRLAAIRDDDSMLAVSAELADVTVELGVYGSKAAKALYDQASAAWVQLGQELVADLKKDPTLDQDRAEWSRHINARASAIGRGAIVALRDQVRKELNTDD